MTPQDYPNISCGLLTKQSFKEWSTVNELFTLWHKHAPSYFPNRFDQIEPIRRPLSFGNLEAMKEIWDMIVFFKRTKSPWLEASCSIAAPYEQSQKYSYLSITAENIRGLESELLAFMGTAAIAASADFAYAQIANNTEFDRDFAERIASVYKCGIHDKYPIVGVHGKHLNLGIPDLYWCTILGKERIEEIGRAKLSGCPVHKVQWLTEDLVMLQLTASIQDSRDNEKDFEELRHRIKKYLGEQLFQPNSWPPGYRPLVDILNEIAAKNLLK
ncbi:hypothetical protein BH11CYA1_BH11CYA1_09370 [soil metagenome]